MRAFLTISVVCLLAVTMSCKKSSDTIQQQQSISPQKSANGIISNAYNLNIVYFIPKDLDTIADYNNRLNGVLVHIQHFVSGWMNKWGYNGKTVGLPVDSTTGRVKLTVIRGMLTKDQYPYNGGSGPIMTEINAYYTMHAEEKSSSHILVILPAYTYSTNGPSGGPFYGLGKWCFALDYKDMDTINLGKPDDKFSTKWIGGLAHELGHGMNLPHDGGAQSQNLLYGTTLMGSGNYTYGKSPTYLTPADAAILGSCQLYSPVKRTDWYTAADLALNKIYAHYENGNIIVSGKYASSKIINDIAYYHRNKDKDPDGYRSVTFEAKPVGTDSFYISMPVSDFRDKGNTNYELAIRFCQENGTIAVKTFNYSFANDIPVLSFGN